MLGRVQGAYRAVSDGGLLGGAAGLTAPLWLGLAAITTVIALAWHAVGTGPDAPHHSGAQRAIR